MPVEEDLLEDKAKYWASTSSVWCHVSSFRTVEIAWKVPYAAPRRHVSK